MGIADADSAEHGAAAKNIIIAPVACPVADRRNGAPKLSGACLVRIQPGCRLSAIYRSAEIEEQYFCNYEVNPEFRPDFEKAGLRFSAFDENGQVRALELPGHPFFIATLFQPQLSSAKDMPHPIVTEFLSEAVSRRA